MTTHHSARVSPGVPAGGQFAADLKTEPRVNLSATTADLRTVILDTAATPQERCSAVAAATRDLDHDTLVELYPELAHLEEGVDVHVQEALDDQRTLDEALSTFQREAAAEPVSDEHLGAVLASHLYDAAQGQRARQAYTLHGTAPASPSPDVIRDAYEIGDPKRYALLSDAGTDPTT